MDPIRLEWRGAVGGPSCRPSDLGCGGKKPGIEDGPGVRAVPVAGDRVLLSSDVARPGEAGDREVRGRSGDPGEVGDRRHVKCPGLAALREKQEGEEYTSVGRREMGFVQDSCWNQVSGIEIEGSKLCFSP